MAKRTRTHLNIPMCLAGVLFCLTLFSFHFSSGVIARYSATAGGSDSARVIKFGELTLTEIGDDKQYVYPGATLEWNAKVSFTGSESATYVFLQLTGVEAANATQVTPFKDGPAWTVAAGWDYFKATDGAHIYYRSLAPNATLSEVALFSNTNATVSTELIAPEIAALPTINADFRAHVVQSNGFDSVQAAWASLDAKDDP